MEDNPPHYRNFSLRVKEVITHSRQEALRLGHGSIGTEHLLLGIIKQGDGLAVQLLQNLGCNLGKLKRIIEEAGRSVGETVTVGNISMDKQVDTVLKFTVLEAKMYKNEVIGTEHLLMGLLRHEESIAAQILQQEYSITYNSMRAELDAILSGKPSAREGSGQSGRSTTGHSQEPGKSTKSKTPVLDNFGRDLTRYAIEDKLGPVIGRKSEIERIVQVLSRRKKNNPALIGEPGVGKTAIAKGLAMRITQRTVSHVLRCKRIVTLDLASLVAGTKYLGQLEERIKAITSELEKNPDVILLIDDFHATGYTGEVLNILKPTLARDEIRCIITTTPDEYRKHIEKDGVLDRQFQKIMVKPLAAEETTEILFEIKDRYEEHHSVVYTDDALNLAVKLSESYITDRYMPDKAIDVIDEVGALVHLKNISVPQEILDLEAKIEETHSKKNNMVKSQRFEEAAELRDREKHLQVQLAGAEKAWEKESENEVHTVTEDDILQVIAMITGIPVDRIFEPK